MTGRVPVRRTGASGHPIRKRYLGRDHTSRFSSFGRHGSREPGVGQLDVEPGDGGILVVLEHRRGRADGAVVDPGVVALIAAPDLRAAEVVGPETSFSIAIVIG